VPYRESKLTMILQPLLSVSGPKSLLVNINTTPQLFDETINVLKFSCVAKSVNFKEPPAPAPKIKIPTTDSAENSQSSASTSDVESNKSSDASSERLTVSKFFTCVTCALNFYFRPFLLSWRRRSGRMQNCSRS
jgi:hypothetical protein